MKLKNKLQYILIGLFILIIILQSFVLIKLNDLSNQTIQYQKCELEGRDKWESTQLELLDIIDQQGDIIKEYERSCNVG